MEQVLTLRSSQSESFKSMSSFISLIQERINNTDTIDTFLQSYRIRTGEFRQGIGEYDIIITAKSIS